MHYTLVILQHQCNIAYISKSLLNIKIFCYNILAMKKKVAILANGSNYEILYRFEEALYESSKSLEVDYFNFLWNKTPDNCHNGYNGAIFKLPNLKKFDAVVIFNPGLNLAENIDYVYTKADVAHIPVISIGMEYPGFSYIGIDNYSGMKDLCTHLIEEHGVRNIHMIAGSRDNEDSNTRVRAVWDVLNEHGIGIDPNHVYYSDWLTSAAANYVERLIDSGEELPDAFICANDYLAEMVGYVLSTHNINVPNDCIVTGFDHNEEGRIYSPSIASIDQQYDIIGQKTALLLKNLFNGEPASDSTIVSCKFIPGESCGCLNPRDNDTIRKEYTNALLRKRRIVDIIDSETAILRKAMIESESFEDLSRKLNDLFSTGFSPEGTTFYMMLDEGLKNFADTVNTDFPEYTFSENMKVVFGKYNGEVIGASFTNTSELIPEYHCTGPNHSYYFIPICFDSFACGYAVFCDKNEWVLERSFLAFEDVFTEALDLYRRKVRLNALESRLHGIIDKIENDSF